MVKKTTLLIILTFFLALQPTDAFEPFVKSQSNPIQVNANYPGWNEMRKFQSSLIFDQGVFKMWYTTYNGTTLKIAYANSTDGLTWVGQSLLDVYPGFDNHDPAILKTQNGYTLFFAASTNGGSRNFKIYRIDSPDETHFDQNSRSLVLQPSGAMELNAVSSPSVIIKGGNYYLFYLCWGNLGFRICMATSTDGNTWSRCPNNPVIPESGDGPFIFEKEGVLYLFFQTGSGVRQAASSDQLSCNMNWSNYQTILSKGPEVYDSQGIISPNVVEANSTLHLHYTGIGPTAWTLNEAHSLPLTPTPSVTKPIVIIPGLMASWNKEALLHNQQIDPSDWRLNPIVKEYKGLTNTLQNLGFVEDQDYYLFTYDWRKQLDNIAEDLKIFLEQSVFTTHPNGPISLVGHSLGGLTARIYSQKYGTDTLDKVITIGSPHQGVAQTYTALEGGEFDRSDKFMWLLQKIILQLNKHKFQSDPQTLTQLVPVLKDLFPVYNFLTDQNDQELDVNNLSIKNDTLMTYNPALPTIFPSLQTIIGEKGDTLSGYKVGARTNLDILLNLYPDGRPISSRHEIGDFIVPAKSAKADTDFVVLPLDHGEIVYKRQGIETILDSLQIPYDDSQIEEGASTQVFPSLLFLILSPAQIEVEYDGQVYTESEALVFIENAQNGIYTLRVKGKELGQYSVIIGQIGTQNDIWSRIEGKVDQNPPTNQTDSYTITFNQDNPLQYAINLNNISSNFDLLAAKIKKIYDSSQNIHLSKALDKLKKAKDFYNLSKLDKTNNLLELVHTELFNSYTGLPDEHKQNLFGAVSDLENLYSLSLQALSPKPRKLTLVLEHRLQKSLLKILEKVLLFKNHSGENIADKAFLLKSAQEKLDLAEESLRENNLWYVDILLLSVKKLLQVAS